MRLYSLAEKTKTSALHSLSHQTSNQNDGVISRRQYDVFC